jgi:hypothetical protein
LISAIAGGIAAVGCWGPSSGAVCDMSAGVDRGLPSNYLLQNLVRLGVVVVFAIFELRPVALFLFCHLSLIAS